MKKYILIAQGGGRPKGNTAQLISAFTQGAESADQLMIIRTLSSKWGRVRIYHLY